MTQRLTPVRLHDNSITDAAPQETCAHRVEPLHGKGLAYLHGALFGTPFD